MFEPVREPRFSRRREQLTEAIPHSGLHDRRCVILDDDDVEAVR